MSWMTCVRFDISLEPASTCASTARISLAALGLMSADRPGHSFELLWIRSERNTAACVHASFVVGIQSPQVQLSQVPSFHSQRPWIRDVLDDVLMIGHQQDSPFQLSKNFTQSRCCLCAHV